MTVVGTAALSLISPMILPALLSEIIPLSLYIANPPLPSMTPVAVLMMVVVKLLKVFR